MRKQHPETLATTLSCAFCPAQLVDSVQLQLHTATCPGMARADAPAARAQADRPGQQLALVPVAVLPHPEVVRSASEPLLAWLGQSPVYEMERQVKSTLLITDAQLRQPSTDLRFLMQAAGTTELRALIEPATVQRILDSLLANGKGPDRVYQLTLLLRKVLVFLFVQQSQGQPGSGQPGAARELGHPRPPGAISPDVSASCSSAIAWCWATRTTWPS